ncbi:tRNA (adenine-N(1)-)-methyltransferase [Ophiocordyceps camponoti-floridani]|uniref:tRNA (adenine(58)-N(1))-methyltransferase catalytic subunit TRM61 n=1 Tax=Ophiocordyceps camponoti-floridani TaxID=2030778 RepID=A0A8H4QA28_9HYPO|nr:tRNA (adenine-N(1)-)-methyltransferase [Ophiocordyceps camponoti-floridani]
MALRRVLGLASQRLPPTISRSLSTVGGVQEHDVVLLRQQGPKCPKWILTAPVRAGGRVKLAMGRSVAADDLLGRRLLDRVLDSGGSPVVIHEASLTNYVLHSNSSRLVTPIYPHDANTIVSLLDLNPVRPGEDDDILQQQASDGLAPPFEVFEAGTGMGSLTLHLARALHAANPPFPPDLRRKICAASAIRDPCAAGVALEPEDQAAFDSYRASRRLVLHSLDQSAERVKAACKFIRYFRRALYLPNIDFHIGTVEAYVSQRLAASSGQPFLSRAVLDVASPEEGAASVIQALHPGALLVVFQPSISQIAAFDIWERKTKQPVRLEKVIELSVGTLMDGLNDAGSGRPWSVKMWRAKADKGDAGEEVQVLRPKVGGRVVGGGFVAVYRRWPVEEMASESVPEEQDSDEPSQSDTELETQSEPEKSDTEPEPEHPDSEPKHQPEPEMGKPPNNRVSADSTGLSWLWGIGRRW